MLSETLKLQFNTMAVSITDGKGREIPPIPSRSGLKMLFPECAERKPRFLRREEQMQGFMLKVRLQISSVKPDIPVKK